MATPDPVKPDQVVANPPTPGTNPLATPPTNPPAVAPGAVPPTVTGSPTSDAAVGATSVAVPHAVPTTPTNVANPNNPVPSAANTASPPPPSIPGGASPPPPPGTTDMSTGQSPKPNQPSQNLPGQASTPNTPGELKSASTGSGTSGFDKANRGDRAAAQMKFAAEVREVCNKELGVDSRQAQATLDPSVILNFISPLENVLEQKGLDFLKNNVVPMLITKLDDVKSKYGFDLVVARALLDGLKNATE
jgi:hypothetical protein